jgi:hypothetical protein
MNSEEEKNIQAAKAMARLSTTDPDPRFHGWYSANGGWVGWYDGGQTIWLKDDKYDFGSPP